MYHSQWPKADKSSHAFPPLRTSGFRRTRKSMPGYAFRRRPILGRRTTCWYFRPRSQPSTESIRRRTSTNTNTSTTPVSGNGTVTDNYGGMWNYTYDGTVTTTTTTTTTTHDDLPYTDTSNTLYLRSYDQNGRVISERWRTITTRQGGDGANTLGYNLGQP